LRGADLNRIVALIRRKLLIMRYPRKPKYPQYPA
jgi:hypothetical protein